ncbi:HAD family hydrolase [Streptomyces triticirhizae]|uniref:HAD family phosphatase n=1 Tax=Streptomyces triticirhizae TaxID=2483353 RepID=A0A3M2L711_9ACTN|nr:HAD family hydrolase [Streptomyces triticirhizae]RMI32510.1 HAD family phosphatase [Streptomyces triticirhizae]
MRGPGIGLVATDLDGTFWDRDGRVHPRTAAAVATLGERGVPVLAVTGRRHATAAPLLRAAGVPVAATVCLDGAIGREGVDGEVFHRDPLPPGRVGELLAVCREAGVEPCAVVDAPDRDLFVGARPTTHPDHLAANQGRVRRCGDLADALARRVVLSLVVCGGDPGPLGRLAARVEGLAQASLTRDTVHGGAALSLRRPGTGKWRAVAAYCARAGLDPGRVLALGDGANDLDLLAHAAVALVPEGADPGALALATRTVPGPERGGWAALLGVLR